jgi:hypothetical protein
LRYVIRTLVGFGLIAFCIAALAYSIYQLLQIGTCASGGPYVSARQCPPGTERLGFGIPIVLLGLIVGCVIYAGRGIAPGSDRPPNHGLTLIWVWTGIFWGIAAAAFLGVWGPDANPGPGAKTGGLIVAFLFVPMGLLGFFGLKIPLGRSHPQSPSSVGFNLPGSDRVARAAVRRMPGLDPVGRLERLEQLRKTGVVTDAEFAKLKAEILSE